MPSSLNAVFSFNRGPMLENCIRSMRHFDPESRTVVFDDNSDDPETLRVLERISRDCELIPSSPIKSTLYGNLYENMNRALELAEREGYELVHFMQDDTQIVWRRPDLLEHVNAVFASRPKAFQMQVHFVKRLGQSDAEPLRDLRAYRITTPGGDLGFMHVARVRESGLQCGPTEKAWALRAEALGLEVYASADPVIARIPWPQKTKLRRMKGSVVFREREFLLRPLDAATVARLTARDISDRPWGEDWYVPWGWRCWAPYPTVPSYARWGRALVTTAVRRRSLAGLRPRLLGDLESSQPPPP